MGIPFSASKGCSLDWRDIVSAEKRGELSDDAYRLPASTGPIDAEFSIVQPVGDTDDSSSVFEPPVFVPDWGGEKPVLAGKSPIDFGDWECCLWLGDIHGEFVDWDLFSASLNLMRSLRKRDRLHRIVFGGDQYDLGDMGRWTKAKRAAIPKGKVQKELSTGLQIKGAVRDSVGSELPIDELEGNHDSRYPDYFENEAQALNGLDGTSPSEAFGWEKYNITNHPRCGVMLRDWFLAKHGDATGQNVAKKELERHRVLSGISGHIHKEDHAQVTVGGVQYKWLSSPAMCRTNPDYIDGDPRWDQGLVFFMLHRELPIVHFEVCRWNKNVGLVCNGNVFT